MTNERDVDLRIDLGDFDDEYRYATYTTFNVGSEKDKFVLKVDGYSGDAGIYYHRNLAQIARWDI